MIIDLVTKPQVQATMATSTSSARLLQDSEREADLSAPRLQACHERLSTQVGAGNDEAQERWLARSGLNRAQIAVMLSSCTWDEEVALPAWIETLDEILCGFGGGSLLLDRCLPLDEPLPFEELLLPFVLYARQRLALHVPGEVALLAPQALASLERWLLTQLSQQARQALQVEFCRFCMQQEPRKKIRQKHSMQHDLYAAFVEQYHGERLLQLLLQDSVLARLLVLHMEQWVESSWEFLYRLAMDYVDLAQFYQANVLIGLVTEITPGYSDRYDDGRIAWLLTFRSGLRLIYTPRSLDVESAFDMLASINAANHMPPPREIHILSQITYGWTLYGS